MADARQRYRLGALKGTTRRIALHTVALCAALIALLQGDKQHAKSFVHIATLRGPGFSAAFSLSLASLRKPRLTRLVERITRTHLVPGSDLARIRSTALTQLYWGKSPVNVDVANALLPTKRVTRTVVEHPYRPEHGGRQFIVARSATNPYYEMMYSKLGDVGFNVHYVTTFTELAEALAVSQNSGEHPHVHIDHWITSEHATYLVSQLRSDSTLSLSIHDLERNASRPNDRTGMRIYLQRANAIHLLTRSSLQRLRIYDQSIVGRVFHVPHPSYYGEHAGEYQLPRDQAAARNELGRRADEFAVGLVGRVSDRKNVELLLSAAGHLLQQPHQMARVPQIYICGALRTKFAERIIRRSHELSNVTVIASDLEDKEVGLHVAALDVGVVPYNEYLNSGWTLLALSGGLPIVASYESTAREVVPPGAFIGYSEGDAQSLAHAIAQSAQQSGEVSRAAALARAYEVHPDFIATRFAQEIAARCSG